MSTTTNTTTADTDLACSVCWLGYELDFAFDEYGRRLPAGLDRGIDQLLGHALDAPVSWSHEDHDLTPGALEAAADAAEFIASWRGTNTGPTRPRVRALFCSDCLGVVVVGTVAEATSWPA